MVTYCLLIPCIPVHTCAGLLVPRRVPCRRYLPRPTCRRVHRARIRAHAFCRLGSPGAPAGASKPDLEFRQTRPETVPCFNPCKGEWHASAPRRLWTGCGSPPALELRLNPSCLFRRCALVNLRFEDRSGRPKFRRWGLSRPRSARSRAGLFCA